MLHAPSSHTDEQDGAPAVVWLFWLLASLAFELTIAVAVLNAIL